MEALTFMIGLTTVLAISAILLAIIVWHFGKCCGEYKSLNETKVKLKEKEEV